MIVNHEGWRVAALGVFDQYLADLNALVSRDTRAEFISRGFARGRLAFRAWQQLGYCISDDALGFLHEFIQDPVYKPRYREDKPPIPTGVAVASRVISCSALPGEHTAVLYRFVDDLFVRIGALTGDQQPVGYYVVVAENTNGAPGLPSLFVQVV